MRRSWGCDAPTQEPIAHFECPECEGKSPSCPSCHGNEKGLPVHRCPRRVVPAEAFEVLDYVVLVQHGILPAAGGWMDQAATFCEALTFGLNERAAYDKREAEQAEHRAAR